MNTAVTVHSTDLWVKIVEMLQQNWAAIDADGADAPPRGEALSVPRPNPRIAPDRVSPYTRSSSVERTILDLHHDHRRDQ